MSEAEEIQRPHHLVQAPVPPLDVDGLLVAVTGTAAFAVASVVLLLARGWLAATGNGWWLGVALSGLGLGLIGLVYCIDRRRRRRTGGWYRR